MEEEERMMKKPAMIYKSYSPTILLAITWNSIPPQLYAMLLGNFPRFYRLPDTQGRKHRPPFL